MADSEKQKTVASVSVGYEAQRPDWQLITDLLGGTRRMRDCGETYLPKEPLEADDAYNRRLKRSFLYNMFKSALRSIVSQAFSKRTKTVGDEKLPSSLRAIVDDVDAAGTGINTFATTLFESVAGLGHAFIFVDYTDVKSVVGDREISKQEQTRIGTRPIFKIIRACDMLDWEHEVVGGVKTLTWIKFREVRIERDGKWGSKEVEYITSWYGNGEFEIWRNSEQPTSTEEPVQGEYLGTRPMDGDGYNADGTLTWSIVKEGRHSFPGIPLVEVYANRTGSMISEPPLIELGWTNLEHYQSSSDQRNILRHARLAQKVVTGAKASDLTKTNLKSAVDNAVILSNPSSKMSYLEHSGAGIEAGAKDLAGLEEHAKAQGLRPTQERSQNSTATGVMVDLLNITSDAQAWVEETALALESAFAIAAKWTGEEVGEGFKVEVNSEFAQKVSAEDFKYVENARIRNDIDHEAFLTEGQRRSIFSEGMDIEAQKDASENIPGFAPEIDDDGDDD